jgi:hypothetical protein
MLEEKKPRKLFLLPLINKTPVKFTPNIINPPALRINCAENCKDLNQIEKITEKYDKKENFLVWPRSIHTGKKKSPKI